MTSKENLQKKKTLVLLYSQNIIYFRAFKMLEQLASLYIDNLKKKKKSVLLYSQYTVHFSALKMPEQIANLETRIIEQVCSVLQCVVVLCSAL